MQCTQCGAALNPGESKCLSCGTTNAVFKGEGLPPGTIIAGRYKIVEKIGAGGMGLVYRANQQPLDVEVCIKTLHAAANTDPQFPTRFEREARTTSRLRHPNIVSVIDFGTHTDGTMYLVMEFIRGQSLAALTSKGRTLEPARAVHLIGQICDALRAAHAQGVLHRDLKPANIMVQNLADREDFVKVLDFGSALILEGSEEAQRLTQVGTVIGTPAYMAPEHILGKGLDGRVDVYAVGVLLYKLLCGEPPFRGNTQAVLAQHVSVRPDPPSRKNPKVTIPPLLERVVLRALVKDPAQRYPTAAALKEAAEAALTGELDEDFEFDLDAGSVRVEVAAEDRSVVVVSIQGAFRMDAEITTRVTAVGDSFGAVVETTGEMVYLIFGLDREGPEVVDEALRCALEIVGHHQGRPVRVGVHDARASGRGRPGEPGFRYELYGEGRTQASSLASAAPYDGVLIAGPASRRVATKLRLIPVEPPPGFTVPVFHVTGEASPQGSDLQGFQGRVVEQRALLEVAVDAGAGGVCLLLGGEGEGKSWLIDKVSTQAATLGVLWTVVRPEGQAKLGPSHPLSALAALGWNTASGLGAAIERHAADLMMGKPPEAGDALRGERRQQRAVSAAVTGLGQRLEHGAVVIVLDDLHLADDLTWALARRLCDVAPVMGFYVVLSLRDEAALPLTLKGQVKRVELSPLAPKELLSLIMGQLNHELDSVRARKAAQVARGHPLLAVEIARMLNDDHEAGLAPLERQRVLEAIDQLVRQRIERLSQPARRILYAAAILGHAPRHRELVAFGGAYEDLTALMELESRKVLARTSGGWMRFPFPRIRQVALAMVPPGSLSQLHRRAAEIIVESNDSEARQLELGEHLFLSGQHLAAFEVLRGAAVNARYEGLLQQALRCLQLALEAGQRLGAPHLGSQAAAARDMGELLLQLGEIQQAEQVLREASAQARTAEAASLAADCLRLHGRAVTLLGDPRGGMEELEATLRFAHKRGDTAVLLETCVDLVEAAEKSGERGRAQEVLQQAVALMEGLDADERIATAQVQIFNRLGRLELEGGNVAGAIAIFAQALDLAERSDDRYQAAGLLGNLGGAYARQKELGKAIHYTERALRASEDLGDFLGIARQSFNLALLKLTSGQGEASRDLLRSSRQAAERAGWTEGLAMSQAAIAKLDAMAGQR